MSSACYTACMRVSFPFSAIVGQDEMKLALLVAAVDPRIAEIEALSGDAVVGATLYEANCRWCHGSNGRGAHTMYPGGTLSPDLIETILEGLSGMPSFDNLSNQEIADIAAYIQTFD